MNLIGYQWTTDNHSTRTVVGTATKHDLELMPNPQYIELGHYLIAVEDGEYKRIKASWNMHPVNFFRHPLFGWCYALGLGEVEGVRRRTDGIWVEVPSLSKLRIGFVR